MRLVNPGMLTDPPTKSPQLGGLFGEFRVWFSASKRASAATRPDECCDVEQRLFVRFTRHN